MSHINIRSQSGVVHRVRRRFLFSAEIILECGGVINNQTPSYRPKNWTITSQLITCKHCLKLLGRPLPKPEHVKAMEHAADRLNQIPHNWDKTNFYLIHSALVNEYNKYKIAKEDRLHYLRMDRYPDMARHRKEQ